MGNNLIACKEHIDSDSDFICDKCKATLSFVENTSIREVSSAVAPEAEKVTVSGRMPESSSVKIIEYDKVKATDLAKKHIDGVTNEDVLYAYDISLLAKSEKYQPGKYNQSTKVKLSNLNLDSSANYAMLHILENGDTEILPVTILNNSELEFTATSFSVYIVVKVGSNNVTFEGENFTVLDTNGNEITDGTTATTGTRLSFTIKPKDGYGVTDITCVNSNGESAIVTSGYIRTMGGMIAAVTEDLVVNVTTAKAPTITTQPTSVKVTQNETAVFSVVAEGSNLNYQWQYRKSHEDMWVNSDIGSNATTATLSITSVAYLLSGYEFRCLVGDDNFKNEYRIASAIAGISVAEGENTLKAEKAPTILTQPNLDNAKVEVGKGQASFDIRVLGKNVTFTWQYREDEESLWETVPTAIGTVANEVEDSSDSNYITKSTLQTIVVEYGMVGYQFRCMIGNTFYPDTYILESDIVTIIPAQNNIQKEIKRIELEITEQPVSQKVQIEDTATFHVVADGATTYKWQYKNLDDEFWIDCTNDIGVANGGTLTVNTSTMSVDDDLNVTNNRSGYEFRCLVSNSSVPDYILESESAVLSIGQGEIETSELVYDATKVSDLNAIDAVVTLSQKVFKYDGSAKEPGVTITLANGATLEEGVSYEVSYENNTEVGTATAIIKGINGVSGELRESFVITAAEIENDEIVLDTKGPDITNIAGTEADGKITITATIEDPIVESGVPGAGVNTEATRYAITTSAEAPAADSAEWQASNEFISPEATTVYLWVKAEDMLGNVTIKSSSTDITEPNYSVEGVFYETLAEAYNAIKGAEGTIIVEKDNVDSSNLLIAEDKKVTINTNGKAVTKIGSSIENDGILIITGNGSETEGIYTDLADSPNAMQTLFYNAGKMYIQGSNLVNRGMTDEYWYVIRQHSRTTSEIHMTGGTVRVTYEVSEGGTLAYTSGGRGIEIGIGKLEMTGGTIEVVDVSKSGIALCSFISTADETRIPNTITISGGTIRSCSENAILVSASSNYKNPDIITITDDAVIEGPNAITIKNSFVGEFKVLGGKINATAGVALTSESSEAKIIIGDDDDNVSTTTPEIIATNIGVKAPNGFEFYDGIIKGKSNSIYGDIREVVTKKADQHIVTTESKDGYKVSYLVPGGYYSVEDIFFDTLEDANKYIENSTGTGTIKVLANNVDKSTFEVKEGNKVTIDLNGKTITKTSSGITNNGTLIIEDAVGAGAIQSEPTDTNSVNVLINNTGTVTLNSGTLMNRGTKDGNYVTISGGNININGGLVRATAEGATAVTTKNSKAIDVSGGTLNVMGGTIEGDYIAIESYSDDQHSAAQINISNGNIQTIGPDGYACIHLSGSSNNSSSVTITGGELINLSGSSIVADEKFTGSIKVENGVVIGNTYGIYNEGSASITIGNSDGTVSKSTPIIQGGTYGIETAADLEFYDGILKGGTSAFSEVASISEVEPGYEIFNDTEDIDGTTYQTAYLVKLVDAITLTRDKTEWTNTDVIVTISWPETIYQKQIKLGEGVWQDYSESTIAITRNTTLQARIILGEEVKTTAEIEIDNIDKTAPKGKVRINSGDKYTNSSDVVLTLTDIDLDSGVTEMSISNEAKISEFEPFADSKDWILEDGEGLRGVYVVLKDAAGNMSLQKWGNK